jgi:nucleoside-triphosphatase THEP1
MRTKRIIILSGERGAGKSTVCRETVALTQARGYTCGGLLTLSCLNGTLDVLDLKSGHSRRLALRQSSSALEPKDQQPSRGLFEGAHPARPELGRGTPVEGKTTDIPETDATPAVIQGRFRFDPRTLAWGNEALRHATPCQLLVVDELGPLEVERQEGWTRAFDVLNKADFGLALVVVRPECLVRAQLQLPASTTAIFTVAPDNRAAMPDLLLGMLERELP